MLTKTLLTLCSVTYALVHAIYPVPYLFNHIVNKITHLLLLPSVFVKEIINMLLLHNEFVSEIILKLLINEISLLSNRITDNNKV